MDAVPAERAARSSCARSLRGVEHAEDLDRARSGARAARGTRSSVYSRRCHGLSTSRRPAAPASAGWASRCRRPARPRRCARSSAPGSWTCSIVCRKTIASTRPVELLDQAALEAQVRPPVAQARRARGPRGWRRPRRPRRRARASRSDAVALAAGEVGDAQALRSARRSTRRRRGGGGTSSSPRARRAACARRSARAAARPRAGRPGRSLLMRPRTSTSAVAAQQSAAPCPCQPRPATAEQIKDVNVRYHDARPPTLRRQVGHRLRRASARPGDAPSSRRRSAGGPARAVRATRSRSAPAPATSRSTCSSAGVLERATATDISPGMLEALQARRPSGSGSRSTTVRAEAEELPFEDESFDLVFGHAVLHHIPDLERRFGEFRRVLRPGGTLAFCGEPSRYGDLLAALPKRAALLVAPLWRRADRRRRRAGARTPPTRRTATSSSGEVDVHAFDPGDAARASLERAGFDERADPRRGAGRERLRLGPAHARGDRRARRASRCAGASSPSAATSRCSALDAALLEPRLPPALFYNLVLSARNPASGPAGARCDDVGAGLRDVRDARARRGRRRRRARRPDRGARRWSAAGRSVVVARGPRPGRRAAAQRPTIGGGEVVEVGGQWVGPEPGPRPRARRELGLETFPTHTRARTCSSSAGGCAATRARSRASGRWCSQTSRSRAGASTAGAPSRPPRPRGMRRAPSSSTAQTFATWLRRGMRTATARR